MSVIVGVSILLLLLSWMIRNELSHFSFHPGCQAYYTISDFAIADTIQIDLGSEIKANKKPDESEFSFIGNLIKRHEEY